MFIKSFITGNNRKNQGIKKETKPSKHHKNEKFLEKKENKATPFVILAFLVYTFNINAMC